MNKLAPGIPAEYKYNSVTYSHVLIQPGEQALLAADPWSMLRSHFLIEERLHRGRNRENQENAYYFIELAEDFYNAAAQTRLPTQATLYYYGMLNLVKALLSANGVMLGKAIEHHGLSLSSPENEDPCVEVHAPMTGAINLFHEFMKVLGHDYTGRKTRNIGEAIKHVPELHGVWFSLAEEGKRSLLPVDIEFFVNTNLDRVFTEISYKKRQEQKVKTNKFYKGKRAEYFLEPRQVENSIVHRSKNRKSVSNSNWPRIYKNILCEYKKFGIVSLLTKNGYRYYCNLDKKDHHHLGYSLIVMFYLGSIARYRPADVRNLMESEVRPMLTEANALCPDQFLYQISSHILKRACVVPYAKLDV